MEKYEYLDALLDKALLNDMWLDDLQKIREAADEALNSGELAQYQWQALVTRSAKIQDIRNGD